MTFWMILFIIWWTCTFINKFLLFLSYFILLCLLAFIVLDFGFRQFLFLLLNLLVDIKALFWGKNYLHISNWVSTLLIIWQFWKIIFLLNCLLFIKWFDLFNILRTLFFYKLLCLNHLLSIKLALIGLIRHNLSIVCDSVHHLLIFFF